MTAFYTVRRKTPAKTGRILRFRLGMTVALEARGDPHAPSPQFDRNRIWRPRSRGSARRRALARPRADLRPLHIRTRMRRAEPPLRHVGWFVYLSELPKRIFLRIPLGSFVAKGLNWLVAGGRQQASSVRSGHLRAGPSSTARSAGLMEVRAPAVCCLARASHSHRKTFAEITVHNAKIPVSAATSAACADQGSPTQIPFNSDTM